MSGATRSATLIDAGVGNLGNLARALEHELAGAAGSGGGRVTITADPETIAASRCLLLPGVGAFAPPREALRGPMEGALRAALDDGAWLLGVCVGFQILFETGEEFGRTDGLALLPGRVTRLPEGVPLPHIGWNRLRDLAPHPLLAGLCEDDGGGPYVYFVHSYAPEGVPADLILARCRHGRDFPALAGRNRVWGAQFHPERSGPPGLRLLSNFMDLAHGTDPRT